MKGPAEGWRIRKATHGTVHQRERGVPTPSARRFASGPPVLSNDSPGNFTSPTFSGSTDTVVPSDPPGRGSVSGRGSTWTFMRPSVATSRG
jgi:hypothetical protein